MRRGGLADAFPRAAEIVADVRDRGDAAVLEWTERLDGERPDALRLSAEEIAAAEVEAELLAAARQLADAIVAFHRGQRPRDVIVETVPGLVVERRFHALDSVGIYVPGGRAPLVSSLLMCAVPAQLAGVRRIAVATPRPPAAVLAVAQELGLGEIYRVGGAQAIAALAHGTETIRPVDKIVGAGNRFVTAAKLLVGERVATDLAAGPSEVMVVADETADPDLCAADLLAQAEHGPDSEALLVTTSAELADAVAERTSGWAQVAIELVGTLEEALARADAYAPEHLELQVADPEGAASRVANASAVFLGPFAPAVLGDYAAGANHVLPTGGLARAVGGLGLEAFLKPVQVVRASAGALAASRETVRAFATAEGLPLHVAAVDARLATAPQ